MSWRISPSSGRLNFAPATNAWLAAVEAADGQLLENGVYNAMGAFGDYRIPLGGACCLMAGARTLAGALVPMVGEAPTNVGGFFVAGDYDRTTGLKGDGTTKYLDSNRNNNADPQNSNHNAIWVSQGATVLGGLIGIEVPNITGSNNIFYDTGTNGLFLRNRAQSLTSFAGATPCPTGFIGHSRSAAASFLARANLSTITATQTSGIPHNGNIYVFRREGVQLTNSRLSYYSIGPAVDLTAMDTAITTCMNALAAAGI